MLCLFFNFFDTKYIAAAPPYFATNLSEKLKFPACRRKHKIVYKASHGRLEDKKKLRLNRRARRKVSNSEVEE